MLKVSITKQIALFQYFCLLVIYGVISVCVRSQTANVTFSVNMINVRTWCRSSLEEFHRRTFLNSEVRGVTEPVSRRRG